MKLAVLSTASAIVLAASLILAPGTYADPREDEPHVHVIENCGQVELRFNNVGGVDGEAFFRYWVNDEPAGPRFEVPNGEREDVVLTFEEDSGDYLVEWRIWVNEDPMGPREGVVVESNCLPDESEVALGSITIVKNANGAGNFMFDFEGDLGNFNLQNDEQAVFTDLPEGSYTVDEISAPGWELVNIECAGSSFGDTDISDGDVRIDLGAGDEAVCVFTNERVQLVVPTATATNPPAPTATATVVPVEPEVIIVNNPPIIVEVPRGVITPPNTGDAGLLN